MADRADLLAEFEALTARYLVDPFAVDSLATARRINALAVLLGANVKSFGPETFCAPVSEAA